MDREEMQREFYNRMLELTDDELRELIRIAQLRLAERHSALEYRPENDPILTGEGLINGDDNLAEHVEDILYGGGDDHDTRSNKLG